MLLFPVWFLFTCVNECVVGGGGVSNESAMKVYNAPVYIDSLDYCQPLCATHSSSTRNPRCHYSSLFLPLSTMTASYICDGFSFFFFYDVKMFGARDKKPLHSCACGAGSSSPGGLRLIVTPELSPTLGRLKCLSKEKVLRLSRPLEARKATSCIHDSGGCTSGAMLHLIVPR